MGRIDSRFVKTGGSSLALAMALLAPALAFAQEAPADETAVEDNSEIVVTGSRMRGVAPVGSTVTTLSTADIAESGRVTLDRAIKELPQVFDLGVSENSRGQSGGAGNIVYGNSINLRGIGPNATLILVDGHRVANNSRSTDPSVLPTLGVERVEIVADGASAIYGSDAVAGVVNLIPRRSLDGAEAFARAGVSDDGAYHEYAFGAAVGKKWDRGQFMVAYEHVEKSNLNGLDRPFFTSDQRASGGNDFRTTRCNPGTISAVSGGVTRTYAIPLGGLAQGAGPSLTAGTTNRCDDLLGQDLIPKQKYDSVNGTFTYELTDWLTFFADGFYSYRKFERINAFTNQVLSVPTTNAWFVDNLPGTTPGTAYSVNYNFSGDAPRIVNRGYGKSWQITPGVRIKLPHDWQFEALFGIGKTEDDSIFDTSLNTGALTTALASSDPNKAFDPYGFHRTSPAIIAGLFNAVSVNPTIGRFKGYEARVNGPLFSLPGGQVKLAAGYEGQEWSVDLGGPAVPVVWRYFGRRVDSAYAELLVPIFGPDNATAGFRKLEIDAAVRYDKYSDVGSTTNPKFGITWVPLDGLTLRGSYGTSFRAPTITQIYGNSNRLFVQNYTNPNGPGTIQGVALSGGNLNLKPETATTWSFGADIEPVRNLRLSLTYFSVDYKNQVIALLSDLALLARASQYDGTGLILTGTAATDMVTQLLNQGVPVNANATVPNPVPVFVDGRSQNLGRSVTRGIDFTANYTLETAKAGTFNLGLNGTYLTSFRTQQTPTAPAIDQLNQIFQPLRFKLRASVNWEKGPFSANVRWTHINGYLNTVVTPNHNVGSYNPIDVGVSFRVGEKDKAFVFGVEVRNLFDIDPPYVNIAPSTNGSGGYDATAADPVGRLVAFSVRKKI